MLNWWILKRVLILSCCKSIDINTSAPVSVHKDGESGGISDKISIFLENNSLKVIMPMV